MGTHLERPLRGSWLAVALLVALAGCPTRYGGGVGVGNPTFGRPTVCPPGALAQPLPQPTTFCRSETMNNLLGRLPEERALFGAGLAQQHLEQHGYANRTRVFPLAGSRGEGWMVITFPEALDEHGVPLPGPERWTSVEAPVFDDWLDYFRALIRAPSARSRVLIAAATMGGLEPFEGAPSLARFAELTGCSGGPVPRTSSGMEVMVLDYEFERVGASSSRPIIGAGTVPMEQLQSQLALGRCL